MKKYSKKLIYDYIMGNDIDNVDELENDCEFMKEVIELSNDKKMYDILDDNFKGNFELIKFLIFKFKDDEEFCKKIALKFDELSNNDDDIFEIDIIISNLFGLKRNIENVDDIKNCINAQAYYSACKLEFDLELFRMSKELEEFYQTGFIYFKELYKDRLIIIDYFAKNIINDLILEDEKFNLEEYIHTLYKSKEDIQIVGINNIILNYIKGLDTNLYEYAQLHIDVLEDVRKAIMKIENRFNTYNEYKNKQVIEWITEYLLNYIKDSGLSLITSGCRLIEFIANDLNIPELKEDKDDDYYAFYDEYEIDQDVLDEVIKDEYEMLKNDQEYILLKKYIENIYDSKIVPDDYEEDPFTIYIEEKNQKVLSFKKKNKK